MAKDQGIIQTAGRRRLPPRSAPVRRPPPPLAAHPEETRRRFPGVAQFLREVRIEARKITWPSWKETWITSVMVGVLILLTALFFFGVDWVLGLGMGGLLRLVNGG